MKPSKESVNGGTPVASPAPVRETATLAQSAPFETGGFKPSKESVNGPAPVVAPAPAPSPTAASETTFETGGFKPSKESVNGPATATPVTPKPESEVLQPTKEQQAAAQDPVIVFSRTPCLGTCPHFTARLFADGRVQYEGFRYAPVEGQQDTKMDPATVRGLLRESELIGFQKMENSYVSGATDLPATILTITYPDGSTKTVRAEDTAPVELRNLFAAINTHLNKALGVTADQ